MFTKSNSSSMPRFHSPSQFTGDDSYVIMGYGSVTSSPSVGDASSPSINPSSWEQTSPMAKSHWSCHLPSTASFGDCYLVQNSSDNRLIGSLVREEGHPYSLAASGGLLYTGSDSKNIRVWKNQREYSGFKSNSGLVKSIVISEDNIFTGHQDGKIRVWKMSRKNPTVHTRIGTLPTLKAYIKSYFNPSNYIEVRRHRNVPWIKHFDAISSLSLSEDQNFLYSASWDKSVKVWRVSNFECLESIPAHDDAVNAVVAGFNGLVVSGSADGTVKVWRRELQGKGTKHFLSHTLLKEECAVTALAINAPTATTVYSGSSDGVVYFWEREKLGFRGRELRDLNPDVIESCLINHAKKCFPGSARSNGKPSSSSVASDAEQRELLETIATNLPLEKSSIASTSTRFLFGLLRYANILKASEASKAALERKIGAQLEQATLDDLLIPSYSYLNETLYDIDCSQRMLGYFLESYKGSSVEADDANVRNVRSSAMMTVGKLVDGYLSEIASDANLKPERFYELAISLPAQGRIFDDGLYGAIDVYLKAHPSISEVERENICRAMDCHKLTLEACTHAAQNDRLPLCTVIQLLFVEQLQLRHAIAGTLIAADTVPLDSGSPSAIEGGDERGDCATEQVQDSNPWRAAIGEDQVLRFDMSRMRSRVNELERMCWTMKKAIEKIDNAGPPAGGGWRNSVGRKFGCKFKTQVCDSHESTVVVASKARHQSNRHRSSS